MLFIINFYDVCTLFVILYEAFAVWDENTLMLFKAMQQMCQILTFQAYYTLSPNIYFLYESNNIHNRVILNPIWEKLSLAVLKVTFKINI